MKANNKAKQEEAGCELPPILKAKDRGKVRGKVKDPPADAPPVEAGPIAEEHATAKAQKAIKARAKATAKVKPSKSSTKVKHKPTQEDKDNANIAVAQANADYCPVMRDAHSYGHDSLASRVVNNLKDYGKLIKADPDCYVLFTIQRGGVTLPPLRKVYHKVAAIISVDTIPGKTEYSPEAKASIREYYNKVKKAHVAFLASVKSEDTAKISLKGTQKIKDGVKSFNFKITEVTKVSQSKLEAAKATSLFGAIQETTDKLTFNVAKSHVFNAIAMTNKPDRARFAIWRNGWQNGDKLPEYCAGHRVASLMDKEETTVAVAFSKFLGFAQDWLKQKAKASKQSGSTNLKDVLGVK
jgi:hypothetical protein